MNIDETLDDENVFEVQVNNIDTYQSFPTPLDRAFNPSTGQKLFSIPIIRLYTSTPTGRNVLIHVHGVYPYIYIEYTEDLSQGKFLSYSFYIIRQSCLTGLTVSL